MCYGKISKFSVFFVASFPVFPVQWGPCGELLADCMGRTGGGDTNYTPLVIVLWFCIEFRTGRGSKVESATLL